VRKIDIRKNAIELLNRFFLLDEQWKQQWEVDHQ